MIEPVVELSWVGVALAPIVIALTSLVKSSFPSVEGRWSALVALGLGVVLSYVVGGVLFLDSEILGGIVVGLMASGMYSGGRATFAGR